MQYSTDYNARKYFPGSVWESNGYGKFEVLGRSLDNPKAYFIKFLDTGYEKCVPVNRISNGKIYDPLRPSVQGVGYQGEGGYSKQTHPKEYQVWKGMLTRCYDERKFPSYKNVNVDSRWHNFQTFCEDLPSLAGYTEWKAGKDYQLDKDLLNGAQEHKVYSLTTCQFITTKENTQEPHRRALATKSS